MLPSMPIIFSRESQDAFGNRIESIPSFFGLQNITKPIVQPVPSVSVQLAPKSTPKAITVPTTSKDNKEQDDAKISDNDKEAAQVAAFYTKVQSKFSSNLRVPHNKFVQFRDILKSFDPNNETVIDLYKKIEQLFGNDQKELVDEFLLYLTPSQASGVGRFMDFFLTSQLAGFLELLQNTFNRKPAMLRKVLRAISASLKCNTVDEMKSKVLPHLRSVPRLSRAFKALFSNERPPDSVYENGVDMMDETILSGGDDCETWDFEDKSEETDRRRNLDPKGQLDSVYMQGRVFLQHGRNLRPARVTFPFSKEPYRVSVRRLASLHCRHSSPDSETEVSPTRKNKTPKRTKKTAVKTTKKDVNDNTKHTDNIKSKKSTKKKKDESQKREKKDAKKQKSLDVKKNSIKTNNWTRDEDKTMLEVLKGEAVSEQVFERIGKLLPHRTVPEIKDRFFHVMTLLQKMAVGEVT